MRHTRPNHTTEVVEHIHQVHYRIPGESSLKQSYLKYSTHKAEATREGETRAHDQHWIICSNLV